MKQTNKNRKTKNRTFTINDERMEKLRKASETTGIPQSQIISRLIDQMARNETILAIVCADEREEAGENWATAHNRHYEAISKSRVEFPSVTRRERLRELHQLKEELNQAEDQDHYNEIQQAMEAARQKWGLKR